MGLSPIRWAAEWLKKRQNKAPCKSQKLFVLRNWTIGLDRIYSAMLRRNTLHRHYQ